MIELAAISVVLLVFSIVGIVWDIASGLLVGGVDGILLLAVCLMMGGVFTLELFLVGRQAGWVPAFGGAKKKDAPQPAAASAKVAASATAPATSVVAAKPPAAPKPVAAPTSAPPAAKAPHVPANASAGIPEPIPPAPVSPATSGQIAAQPPASTPPDGRAAPPMVAPPAMEQPKPDSGK